ncbi:hypothetical protein R1sor_026793 [Riccia sorocarpa]|uniref:Importin N-terminal domain-containing protein n=1 Tax=Riccia sorocarpa TaxID=122646 RepID=A0ABD3GCG7_9MARC
MAGQESRAVLLEALQALYHHPDPSVRTAANQWLEQFQQTMEAWQVSDSVLHDPSSSLEALYFCALTIRTKVQRDYEDLPPSAPLSLRNSLLTLLIKFRQGPPAVRTQLCMGMVALAIHMSPEEWGSGGVVQWFGKEVGSQVEAIPCLLELMTVLPQEAQSYKISVRPERRRQFQRELVESVQDAFSLLTSCLRDGAPQLREQVLRAFAAWMRLSYGISAATLATHPLVAASLSGLDSEETFDAAVDAALELIRYTVSGNPVDLAAHMSLVQVIVPKIMALKPRFGAAVKAAVAEKQAQQVIGEANGYDGEEEDEETVKGMAYLFAEMGESYVELIATGTSEALMIVEAIAEVTAHPDDNISAITFTFWHRLSQTLTSRDEEEHTGEEQAAMEALREKRITIFRPTFELLVSLVSFRVKYPKGFEAWRKDELQDFKETRYAVADMLLDAANVLGGEATLRLLSQPLLQMAASLPNGGSWEWESLEASLYCIRAIAKTVPLSENVILPQIMTLLPQLPPQPQLLYTSSLTIAALADWLGAAPTSRTLLPLLLRLLTSALAVPEDPCAAAALALKHVCDACNKDLGQSVDALLELYRQVMSGQGNFHLAPEDELQLVEGLSIVVSSLPADKLPQAVEALCIPVSAPLEKLVASAQQGGPAQTFTANQYILHIDRIGHIFRYITQPEVLAGVFQRMWPLLKLVFVQRAGDGKSMERLCRACKFAVRNCGRALGPTMGLLLEELQERYQQHQHSCFLYLASVVIKVYGSDPACASYLGTLISVLFGQTVRLLQNIQDFTSRPDLADDCFLLASRCIRYCPQLLVSSPILAPLFSCALAGITVQHREACRSILTFLEDLLDLPSSDSGKQFRASIDEVVTPAGLTLTRLAIACLVGALPESRMDEVIQLLISMIRLYGQLVAQWARDVVGVMPATVVKESEKLSFLQAISTGASGTNAGPFTRTMEEMSDVCRRNKKAREAVQNALQPLSLTFFFSSSMSQQFV